MRIHSRLKIFKNRLDHNLELICQKTKDQKLILMLKADAYGHGIKGVVEFLKDYSRAIDYIGLASLGEALFLQSQFRELDYSMVVFSEIGNLKDSLNSYGKKLIPVISDLDDLECFLSNQNSKEIPLFLKFNTGMNRLGLNISELEQVINLLKKYDRTKIDHLLSHYSSSYMVDSFQKTQYQIFQKLNNEISSAGIEVHESSIDNSGSIENNLVDLNTTHFRPGLLLYGAQSSFVSKKLMPLKVISDLETKVIKSRPVKKGMSYGYGNTILSENGSMHIIPLGYGDGISTFFKGLEFMLDEYKAKFIGRVNMDLSAIFIPGDPSLDLRGKSVLIWNEDILKINKISKHLKTHPYEIFCMLSSRLPRVYLLE